MTDQHARFLFVVDTADYAGNFERDMCAYITGRVGECGVGREMADLFLVEVNDNAFANVICESDNHGCERPVSIFPSASRDGSYHSVSISFDTRPTSAQIDLMKTRAVQFAALSDEWHEGKPRVSKILGFRLIEQIKKVKVCVLCP